MTYTARSRPAPPAPTTAKHEKKMRRIWNRGDPAGKTPTGVYWYMEEVSKEHGIALLARRMHRKLDSFEGEE